MTRDPLRVRIGDCECPGAPHGEGDFAYFDPRLSVKGGTAGTLALQGGGDVTQVQAELADVVLRYQLLRWDLLDEKGKPIPVSGAVDGTVEWRRLLPLVNDTVDRYVDQLIAPFREVRVPVSSPSGQMDGPTSPTSAS